MDNAEEHRVEDAVTAMLPGQSTQLTTPDQPPPKSRLGFLGLPAEVRNSIYMLLLKSSHLFDIHTRSRHRGDPNSSPSYVSRTCRDCGYEFNECYLRNQYCGTFDYPPRAYLHPNLLQTCRTISKEASPIFYGTNEFSFASPVHAYRFVKRIGGNVKFIRFIQLERINNRRNFYSLLWQLKQATSLNKMFFSKTAIMRFRAFDMSDDLAHLAWALWKANKDKEGVTLETIANIFSFADHRNAPTSGALWSPQWGVSGGCFDDNCLDTESTQSSILSYSGRHIVLRDGEEETDEDDYNANADEEEDDLVAGEDSEYGDDYGTIVIYTQPSKWNIRVREAIVEDLQDTEEYGEPCKASNEEGRKAYFGVFGDEEDEKT